MPGIPRRGAAAGAVAHVRLRPPGVEPDPRRPARPLVPRAHGHQLRADRPGTDRDEEGPGPGVPERGLLGPAAAGTAPPAQGVLRVLRQARPLPQVQVPLLPPVRALHSVGVLPARRRAAAGEDRRAAAVCLVVAGGGPDRPGPGDGDRVPGAGRPLVRDLHHPRSRPGAAPGRRIRGRRRPRREGLRRDLRRGADRQPAASGTQGPQARPLPAQAGPLPARLGEPGQGGGQGRPRPPQGTPTPAGPQSVAARRPPASGCRATSGAAD